MLYTTSAAMQRIRSRLRTAAASPASRDTVIAAWLAWQASAAAARKTACITDFPSPAESGDPHDFFSEGPYWWPDPENPDGPYIRRDGRVNPDRFTAHDDALGRICSDPQLLALAAYHLGIPRFYDAAKEKLRAFFLDPATRMNPHLDYAQAIRGRCPGRGIGIIDATGLHRLIFALDLMEEDGVSDETTDGVRAWLGEFYRWLRTSKNGLEEKYHGNNHSIWYTSLTMALARLSGDNAGFADDCSYFGGMMAKQLREDGAFADETTRTNAFGYCCYNLTAAALVCELAHFGGVDLWHASYGEGRSMRAAVGFLVPYLTNPYKWPYQQINGQVPEAPFALTAAAHRLPDDGAQRALHARSGMDPMRNMNPLGPMELYFAPEGTDGDTAE